MARQWWLGIVTVGLLSTGLFAKPGVVRTLGGEAFEGDITEQDNAVVINNKGVEVRLDRRNVARIVYTDSHIQDEFNLRLAKLTPADVQGRIDLAKWVLQSGRADLADHLLAATLKLAPTNRDAALLQQDAQRQMDMDRRTAAATQAAAAATTQAGASTQTAAGALPSSQPTASAQPEARQLNADEINLMRQAQLQAGDKAVVRFENDVERKYLAGGGHDAVAFRQMAPVNKALEILANAPQLAKDVHVMTDPAPMLQFHNKVLPSILNGCATASCHGSPGNGGDFFLYNVNSNATAYTDFYILRNYTKTIGGKAYTGIEPAYPDTSLVLQYALPATVADAAHPKVNGYRPRFQTKNDVGYKIIVDWMQKGLGSFPATTKFNIAVSRPATSQPAAKTNP